MGAPSFAIRPDPDLAPQPWPLPPLEVLIVDDITFDRRRMMRLCDRAGIRARYTEAATWHAVEAAADQARFDMALIDYHLPDGDGLAAARYLLASPQNGACSVIIVAGSPELDQAVLAHDIGCAGYLAKTELAPELLARAASRIVGEVPESRGTLRDPAEVLEDLAHAVDVHGLADLHTLTQAADASLPARAAAHRIGRLMQEIIRRGAPPPA